MKNFNRKSSGSISKLDMPSYRRRPMASHCATSSHTDMAYREAISRLKHLLSDTSYTPVAHQTTTLFSPLSTYRNQYRDFTKYYPGTNIPRTPGCFTSASNTAATTAVPSTGSAIKESPPCCKFLKLKMIYIEFGVEKIKIIQESEA